MDKSTQLKHRAVRFLELFGIACLLMMIIRLLRIGQINPMIDGAASNAMVIGIVSYLLSKVVRRFF